MTAQHFPQTAGERVVAPASRTGISPSTGLASDFLNQFNEAAMIIDLAADDRELMEDLLDWAPKPYREHFAASGLADSDFVLAAYERAQEADREELEARADALGRRVREIARIVLESVGDEQALAAQTGYYGAEIRRAIGEMSAIIHPANEAGNKDEVAALLKARRAVAQV